jgi:hypothetical protein
MASDSAIWRATTLGAEASNSSDIVEFNDLTLADAQQAGIVQTSTNLRTAVAINAKPKAAVDELQDGGFIGATVIVTGSIKDPEGFGLTKCYKLKEWQIEDKTNTTFTKGRFGLRLGDFPLMNCVPTTEGSGSPRGYIFEDVQFIRDGEVKGKVQVIITLRFNGNVGSPNGSGQYIW